MKLPFKNRIKNYLLKNRSVKAEISFIQPNARLVGKRIIVTGGTGGIGQAMAKRFVAEGAKVLIAGRNEDKLKQLASILECEYLQLDLTKVETFRDFVLNSKEKLGGIDCLVNNAGVSLHETFQTVTPEGFDQQVSTNFRGPFFLTQEVLTTMEKEGTKGQVLFVSSETGETADIRPYGLTKAAVNSLVQGLAYMYIESGIRINAIAPGVTATKMTGFGNPQENLICYHNPNGRAYLPEEMAEVATFLLSDVSNCISGQIITCNNGKTINARWKS